MAEGQAARPEVGDSAPAIHLDLLGGGKASLASHLGRPVVLNFWATWCVPCRQEMPELAAAWQARRAGGLEVLAVNLTDQERLKDVEAFVAELALPFPVLLDKRGRVRERYGLATLPTTYFVDTLGVVRAVHPGPLTRGVLEKGLALTLPAATASD
ncbi:MAG TPA: TlpA disulfide reductase family protein [Myxococcota bacterium]|nr:TlpA disulfide reductase family protein [Myxococcota bacterium]